MLLRAPTDGIVLRVLAEPGELVGPGDDRDLFRLVNRSSTRVRACIEELDAMNVAVGQRAVVIADGNPDRHYAGIVHSCSPYVSPKSQRHLKPGEMVNVRVREVLIELADGSDLLIGLPVDVFIEQYAEAGSAKGPRRQSPLRPTPQAESPNLGQKSHRPPGRADSLESLTPAGGQQPAVQRASAVGEWRESASRE